MSRRLPRVADTLRELNALNVRFNASSSHTLQKSAHHQEPQWNAVTPYENADTQAKGLRAELHRSDSALQSLRTQLQQSQDRAQRLSSEIWRAESEKARSQEMLREIVEALKSALRKLHVVMDESASFCDVAPNHLEVSIKHSVDALIGAIANGALLPSRALMVHRAALEAESRALAAERATLDKSVKAHQAWLAQQAMPQPEAQRKPIENDTALKRAMRKQSLARSEALHRRAACHQMVQAGLPSAGLRDRSSQTNPTSPSTCQTSTQTQTLATNDGQTTHQQTQTAACANDGQTTHQQTQTAACANDVQTTHQQTQTSIRTSHQETQTDLRQLASTCTSTYDLYPSIPMSSDLNLLVHLPPPTPHMLSAPPHMPSAPPHMLSVPPHMPSAPPQNMPPSPPHLPSPHPNVPTPLPPPPPPPPRPLPSISPPSPSPYLFSQMPMQPSQQSLVEPSAPTPPQPPHWPMCASGAHSCVLRTLSEPAQHSARMGHSCTHPLPLPPAWAGAPYTHQYAASDVHSMSPNWNVVAQPYLQPPPLREHPLLRVDAATALVVEQTKRHQHPLPRDVARQRAASLPAVELRAAIAVTARVFRLRRLSQSWAQGNERRLRSRLLELEELLRGKQQELSQAHQRNEALELTKDRALAAADGLQAQLQQLEASTVVASARTALARLREDDEDAEREQLDRVRCYERLRQQAAQVVRCFGALSYSEMLRAIIKWRAAVFHRSVQSSDANEDSRDASRLLVTSIRGIRHTAHRVSLQRAFLFWAHISGALKDEFRLECGSKEGSCAEVVQLESELHQAEVRIVLRALRSCIGEALNSMRLIWALAQWESFSRLRFVAGKLECSHKQTEAVRNESALQMAAAVQSIEQLQKQTASQEQAMEKQRSDSEARARVAVELAEQERRASEEERRVAEERARVAEVSRKAAEEAMLHAEAQATFAEEEMSAMRARELSRALSHVLMSEASDATKMSLAFERWHVVASIVAELNAVHQSRTNQWSSRRLMAAATPTPAGALVWGVRTYRALLNVIGPQADCDFSLLRAMSCWQAAVRWLEALDLRKQLHASSERVRNLKKGWQQERDERLALGDRVVQAEDAMERAAAEQRAMQVERERLSQLVRQREGFTARVRELELQLRAAKEEAAAACDAAKVERKVSQSLRAELAASQTEGSNEARRELKRSQSQLLARAERAERANTSYSRQLAWAALQAISTRLARREESSLELSHHVQRLVINRLRERLAHSEASSVGERWRTARCLVVSMRLIPLSKFLVTWAMIVREIGLREAILGEHDAVAAQMDASQERFAREARQLRAKFDAELKKERALSLTRLNEREALECKLREANMKLKSRSPSPSMDPAKKVPTVSGVLASSNRSQGSREVAQLRAALAAREQERDLLACEVSALQTELDASRELLG